MFRPVEVNDRMWLKFSSLRFFWCENPSVERQSLKRISLWAGFHWGWHVGLRIRNLQIHPNPSHDPRVPRFYSHLGTRAPWTDPNHMVAYCYCYCEYWIISKHYYYSSYIYHIYIIVYYNIPFKGLVPFANFCSWHQEGKRLLPAAVAEMSTVSSGDGLLGPIRDDRPCFVTRVRRATGWKQPENIINKYKKRDKGWLDGW